MVIRTNRVEIHLFTYLFIPKPLVRQSLVAGDCVVLAHRATDRPRCRRRRNDVLSLQHRRLGARMMWAVWTCDVARYEWQRHGMTSAMATAPRLAAGIMISNNNGPANGQRPPPANGRRYDNPAARWLTGVAARVRATAACVMLSSLAVSGRVRLSSSASLRVTAVAAIHPHA